jgi:RNA polymerase sigma-70 factor (ECF subfamily)
MDRGPDEVLDEYLVVLSQAGSEPALRVLVARWSPRLLRYVARTLGGVEGAEDVAQEAWIGVVRGLPRLRDPARFAAWVYGIATRRCADEIRARRRGRRLAGALAAEAAVNGHAVEEAGAPGLDFAAALRSLPPGQRMVVSLHYGEGLATETVADALGIPAGTVKSRLHAARAALKPLLAHKLFLEGDPS